MSRPDIFSEARAKLTIADAWQLLGLSGTPKPSCRSPFRDDKSPSFSIHADGAAWHDHATGEGGDVVEFVRVAIAGDHKQARDWLADRLGTPQPSRTSNKSPQAPRRIDWPGELVEGTSATWKAFAAQRGLTYPAVYTMVAGGILRFIEVNGTKCFVVRDDSDRAGEIRRMDGKLFGTSKTFPLRGVDKSWLPGLEMIRKSPKTRSVLLVEGATDLLSAIDLQTRYFRDEGGRNAWQPIALLGAGCRKLHPDAATILAGRHVRICPDGDAAGDQMADHWQATLRKIGCTTDTVNLPRNTDLSDHLKTIQTTDLFKK